MAASRTSSGGSACLLKLHKAALIGKQHGFSSNTALMMIVLISDAGRNGHASIYKDLTALGNNASVTANLLVSMRKKGLVRMIRPLDDNRRVVCVAAESGHRFAAQIRNTLA